MQKHNKKNGQVIEISVQIFQDHDAGRKTKNGRLSSSTTTTTALVSLV